MSFIPTSEIIDSEFLIRAFKSREEWNFIENRPSSGIFRSSASVSVDRDAERDKESIVEGFRQRDGYQKCGMVQLLAKECRESDCEPSPAPEEENPYHALINGIGRVGTSRGQAKRMAEKSSIFEMSLE